MTHSEDIEDFLNNVLVSESPNVVANIYDQIQPRVNAISVFLDQPKIVDSNKFLNSVVERYRLRIEAESEEKLNTLTKLLQLGTKGYAQRTITDITQTVYPSHVAFGKIDDDVISELTEANNEDGILSTTFDDPNYISTVMIVRFDVWNINASLVSWLIRLTASGNRSGSSTEALQIKWSQTSLPDSILQYTSFTADGSLSAPTTPDAWSIDTAYEYANTAFGIDTIDPTLPIDFCIYLDDSMMVEGMEYPIYGIPEEQTHQIQFEMLHTYLYITNLVGLRMLPGDQPDFKHLNKLNRILFLEAEYYLD